ncbi:transposase, partial [Parafrankia sp. FMc6]|uniref:IS66 family transposase n=1 Tax=Parafrankia soli TaxID=2599596 RepID=UPI0034D42DEB
ASGGGQRGRGGQPGAPGSHLRFTDQPDQRVDRFPEGRCGCGNDLATAVERGTARDLGVVDRYQQVDIPLVTATVTQYDQHVLACGCGTVHAAARPGGARPGPVGYGPNLQAWCVYLMVVHHVPVARCVELLASLTGAAPSTGFVHGLLARAAAALAAAHDRIRALISLCAVVVMDETPLKVGPRLPRPGRKKAERYLLVACTDLYAHFLLGDRDLQTFQASVLSELAAAGATVVHDRYSLYDHDFFNPVPGDPLADGDPDGTDPTGSVEFLGLVHQICTQHLLRDLTAAGETYPDEHWPAQIADALRGLIHHTNLTRHATALATDGDGARGHDAVHCHYCEPPAGPALPTVPELLDLVRQGVAVGLSATPTHGTRPGQRPARLVLEFLRDRQDDVLRFLTDPAVPATSNDAERELRPSKIQQNISGRLTSETVTQDRYTILGYLRTAAKHGRAAMTTLRDVMTG